MEELAVKCAETKRNAVAQAGVMRFKVKSALEELNRLRGLAQTLEAIARGADPDDAVSWAEGGRIASIG